MFQMQRDRSLEFRAEALPIGEEIHPDLRRDHLEVIIPVDTEPMDRILDGQIVQDLVQRWRASPSSCRA